MATQISEPMLVAGRCDRVNFAKENKMCGDGVNGRDAAAKHRDGPLQHGHAITAP